MAVAAEVEAALLDGAGDASADKRTGATDDHEGSPARTVAGAGPGEGPWYRRSLAEVDVGAAQVRPLRLRQRSPKVLDVLDRAGAVLDVLDRAGALGAAADEAVMVAGHGWDVLGAACASLPAVFVRLRRTALPASKITVSQAVFGE